MNIVISGYGKMGREVEKIALSRKHIIVAKLDTVEDWEKYSGQISSADVVIDFSMPAVVVDNIYRCFDLGLPVVTGTTGWYDHTGEVTERCKKKDGSLFYAPNFSIGVNLFFKINEHLARLISGVEGYKVQVEETHHVHKLDAPSGTAIKTAEGIIAGNEKIKKWVDHRTDKPEELPVISFREGEVPGTHTVIWDSNADRITLKHEAKNRSGFALGAVMAAEFVVGKKGVFTMEDLLGI
ncbi:MAG: 4-hydroxy-tetrahydrodipicolinate reductase [Chlorobi bacterium]|nr:4-hydroxy-tetrahydrodipicolinate reductase [Chlorobiota bacterium]